MVTACGQWVVDFLIKQYPTLVVTVLFDNLIPYFHFKVCKNIFLVCVKGFLNN